MMTKYTPILFIIYWGCFFVGFVYFNKWLYYLISGNRLLFSQSLVMILIYVCFFFTMFSYLEWIGK